MIATAPALAAEIAKLRGRKLEAKVTINYSSVYGDDLIDVSSNAALPESYIDQVYNGRFDVSAKYYSLDGIATLDGTWVLAPETEAEQDALEMGWWSDKVPKQDKTFDRGGRTLYGSKLYGNKLYSRRYLYPSIVLFFPERTVLNINIAFDNARMEYAPAFDVIFKDKTNTILHTETVTGNTGTRYSKTITGINLVTQMELIIKSWSKITNAKVAEMLSSVQETYNGSDLFNLQVIEGLDRGNISPGRCVVTLYNKFRKFDYENTTSVLFNQIRKGVRIEPFIGDGTNWIRCGVYYAEAWDIKRRDLRVTVTGVDKVALLQKTQFADSKIIQPPDQEVIDLDSDAEFLAGDYTNNIEIDGGVRLL